MRLAVAAVLALVVAGSVGGCAHDDAGRAARSAVPELDRELSVGVADRAGAPRAERPTSVRLPSGAVVPVRPAQTGPRGILDVPDDLDHAGWWPGGARLGDPFGATLIAGHIDAVDQGIGPFAELLGVQQGDQVRLRSHHLQQVFVVESRQLVPRGALQQQASGIFSVRGGRRLALVTCAPPYDAARGGYQNLAVVTAVAADDAHRRSHR